MLHESTRENSDSLLVGFRQMSDAHKCNYQQYSLTYSQINRSRRLLVFAAEGGYKISIDIDTAHGTYSSYIHSWVMAAVRQLAQFRGYEHIYVLRTLFLWTVG